MRCNLVVTHGYFAEGLCKTLNLFLGENHSFKSICAFVDDVNVQILIDEYFTNINIEDEVLIFTDINFGSVNQMLIPYLSRNKTYLVSGVNLPILLQASCLPTDVELTNDLVRKLVEDSKSSIVFVNDEITKINFSGEDE